MNYEQSCILVPTAIIQTLFSRTLVQSLLDIRHQVIQVFKAYGYAYQALADTVLHPFLR